MGSGKKVYSSKYGIVEYGCHGIFLKMLNLMLIALGSWMLQILLT